jgi:hypothetical protein
MENTMFKQLQLPVHEIELPVTKQKVRIRPFTVKENKILLMALETESVDQMIIATKQIVSNCIVHPELDVDKMAFYDLEFILLNIRAASISEILTLNLSPTDRPDCDECKKSKSIEVNLNSVKVFIPENYNKKIKLDCGLTVCMKDPTYETISKFKELNSPDVESVFNFVSECIKTISDEQTVYDIEAMEVSKEEVLKFIESLPIKDFNKIEKFFEDLPRLEHVVSWECSSCQTKRNYEMRGIESFLE